MRDVFFPTSPFIFLNFMTSQESKVRQIGLRHDSSCGVNDLAIEQAQLSRLLVKGISAISLKVPLSIEPLPYFVLIKLRII